MSGVLVGQFSINIPLDIAEKAFSKASSGLANVTLGLSMGTEGLLNKTFKVIGGTIDKWEKRTVILALNKEKTVLLYLKYSGRNRLFGTFTAVKKRTSVKKKVAKTKK